MRLIVPLLVASWAVLAIGGDCPPPKPLTCERLDEIYVAKHCGPPRCSPVPCDSISCNPETCENWPSCPQPVACQPSVVVERVEVPVYADPPVVAVRERGRWLIGGGPVYSNGLGATLLTGYRWPSGMTLLGGPTWLPESDVDARTCRVGCVTCRVPGERIGGGPGAQVVALWEIK